MIILHTVIEFDVQYDDFKREKIKQGMLLGRHLKAFLTFRDVKRKKKINRETNEAKRQKRVWQQVLVVPY